MCNIKYVYTNGPFRLGATHGRQAPHHPSVQQPRALQGPSRPGLFCISTSDADANGASASQN